jgi:hypothetical protein
MLWTRNKNNAVLLEDAVAHRERLVEAYVAASSRKTWQPESAAGVRGLGGPLLGRGPLGLLGHAGRRWRHGAYNCPSIDE